LARRFFTESRIGKQSKYVALSASIFRRNPKMGKRHILKQISYLIIKEHINTVINRISKYKHGMQIKEM